MCVKDVVINNQVGLHARPATFFIQKANEFKSTVWVEKEERRVNAKSLLGVLSLGIVGGTKIRIIVDGSDEEVALNTLVELVESGFKGDRSGENQCWRLVGYGGGCALYPSRGIVEKSFFHGSLPQSSFRKHSSEQGRRSAYSPTEPSRRMYEYPSRRPCYFDRWRIL